MKKSTSLKGWGFNEGIYYFDLSAEKGGGRLCEYGCLFVNIRYVAN